MDLISVPTVTLCLFIALVAITVAMGAVWRNDRRETSAGFWALGFGFGALTGITVTLMRPGSAEATVVALTLNAVANGFVWAGYRSFGNRSVGWKRICAPAAVVLAANIVFPQIRQDPNNAIMIQSVLALIMSSVNAYEVYTGERNNELPLSRVLACALLLHAAFHGVNLVVTFIDPSPILGGRMQSPWIKIFILEAFLNVVVIATASLMLIKDRSEQRHRIASETDVLTSVANRRAFVQRTELALREAKEDATLAILDLDHFKAINDQFGHQTGDRALVEFAHAVRRELPDDVLFGRFGGEEFALFIPQRQDRDPAVLLDDLRETVENLTIQSAGRPVQLTASIGFASVEKAGLSFDNLVAAADYALYAAKAQGRNRVLMFKPSMRLLKVLEASGESRVGLTDARISRRSTRTPKSSTPHS